MQNPDQPPAPSVSPVNPASELILAGIVPPPTLSQDLERILHEAEDRPMTIGELETHLRGRGIAVMVIVLTMPFCQPIPLPLSPPFGLAIALIGLRLALNRAPWLPLFIRNLVIKSNSLQLILKASIRISRRLEKIFKPRHLFMSTPAMKRIVASAICLGGLLLAIPFPPVVLFTNLLPAWSVLLLTLGLMERDGALAIAGLILELLTLCYFTFVFWAYKYGIEVLMRHFSSGG